MTDVRTTRAFLASLRDALDLLESQLEPTRPGVDAIAQQAT